MRPPGPSPWMIAVALCAASTVTHPARVQAQDPPPSRSNPITSIFESVINLASTLTERTQSGVISLFENLDMLDLKPEIDRMVGLPWELNDATTYKLSLLPYRIRFPIYQQIIQQMTRQDSLRARRIHRVSASTVNAMVLRLNTLAEDDPSNDLATAQISASVKDSLLTHFDAREMADLAVFVLAQQPFFPDNEADWLAIKQRISDARWILAGAAIGTSALFNAGAFGQSGRIVASTDGRKRLGWYGAFRGLGLGLRPDLRAGITGAWPGIEVAAGLAEKVNPSETQAQRALEFAAREGFLGQLTAPQGWDVFAETALRTTIAAGNQYRGEGTTGRAGLFIKRDTLPTLPTLAFRSLAELESDLAHEVRFATGFGLTHRPSGLSSVLQVSRTRIEGPDRTFETRGGLFLAGSTEPPTQEFVDDMISLAAKTREAWVGLRVADATVASIAEQVPLVAAHGLGLEESRRVEAALEAATEVRVNALLRLAHSLADYLESRRIAYALTRRERAADELHGPLGPEILHAAHARIVEAVTQTRAEIVRLLAHSDNLRTRLRTLEDEAPIPAGSSAPVAPSAQASWERDAIIRTLRRQAVRVRDLQAQHTLLLQQAMRTTPHLTPRDARGSPIKITQLGSPDALNPLDTSTRRRLLGLILSYPP